MSSTVTIMEWCVTISCTELLAKELIKVFNIPYMTILEENENIILKSDSFKDLNSKDEVKEKATKMLTTIIGITKYKLNPDETINIDHIYSVDENGNKHAFIEIRDTISVSDSVFLKVTDKNGNLIKQRDSSDILRDLVILSQQDPSVDKVLAHIRHDFETPSGFYKIYEIIQEDVGNIPKKGWCSKSKLDAFKHSCNSPEVFGAAARHAKSNGSKPKKCMTLIEAKSIVVSIVDQWLNEKLHHV